MNYFQLYKANPRLLSLGMMLVFFSSFGQTFVVSLYIPHFMSSFGISASGFSSLYALATLSSAATLIYAGRKIDHIPLKRFALFVVCGIFLACLLTAVSWNLVVLFFGIYALRFFGQGLLMHTAMTTMSRYFTRSRGKALSIAALGFPLGEAVFPVLVASSTGLFGWRETLVFSAIMIGTVLIPFTIFSLRHIQRERTSEGQSPAGEQQPPREEQPEKLWKQREILSTPWFYIFAPTVFLVGFLQTNLFFFQTFIAEEKGWSTQWMAGSITAYAASSIVMSMIAGPMIDRFSARRIFPFILLPLAAGLVVLSIGTHPLTTPFFWLLVGFTGGMNSPVTSSLYAEIFGTRSLGTVRSLFTFVMVVSTALGPVVYSFFLDRGASFSQIHYVVMGVIAINMLFILMRFPNPNTKT